MRQKERIYVIGLNYHVAAQRIVIFSFPSPFLFCPHQYVHVSNVTSFPNLIIPPCRSASASFPFTLSFHCVCVWMWAIDWDKPSHMIRGCVCDTLTYPEFHWASSFIAETNEGKILPLTQLSYIQSRWSVCVVINVWFMKCTLFSKFTNKDLRFWLSRAKFLYTVSFWQKLYLHNPVYPQKPIDPQTCFGWLFEL